MTRPDCTAAREAALRFRGLGYNPLPSRMDVKGPALSTYAEFWERPLPGPVYDDWATTNLQLMTGSRWRLAVIDCDGDAAHSTWRQMKQHHRAAFPLPTWVARTGGGGWHYYFTIPEGVPCPSRRLWGTWDTWAGTDRQRPGSPIRGAWRPHEEVRLLADRSLVIAPPSRHVKTGRAYRFLADRNPDRYERPMDAPAWLLALPAVATPDTSPPVERPAPRPVAAHGGPTYDRNEVLGSIRDKDALAASWGLRFASNHVGPGGWRRCYAVGRDDRTPSASFHVESGVYTEKRDETKLTFLDLAVALGTYSDWAEACNDLGARFCRHP